MTQYFTSWMIISRVNLSGILISNKSVFHRKIMCFIVQKCLDYVLQIDRLCKIMILDVLQETPSTWRSNWDLNVFPGKYICQQHKLHLFLFILCVQCDALHIFNLWKRSIFKNMSRCLKAPNPKFLCIIVDWCFSVQQQVDLSKSWISVWEMQLCLCGLLQNSCSFFSGQSLLKGCATSHSA